MKSAGGPTGSGQDDDELAKAVQLARASDVTILVLGDVQGAHNGGCGEWGDRDDFDLQGGQLNLLAAVSKVAKKTIVILVHGRPQTFGKGNAALEGVDALFAAWRPGVEFGSAMVSLLTGQVSPSAKLSLSWPRSVGQVGSGSSPWLQAVRGKWLANQKGDVDAGDGRRYDSYVSSNSAAATPLFYFGYGLSFTTFRYDKVEVVSRRLLPVMTNTPSRRVVTSVGRELWMVNVTVSNTGTAAGAEVVQVYVRDPVGLPFVPAWKRLVGFARLFLQPGETGTASISVSEDDVALYHDDLSEAINTRGRACKANEPPVLTLFGGTYNVTAGGASNAAVLHQLVTV
jgi:beta-glucosidase